MPKLKLGVIGCGAIAQEMHLPLVTRLSEFAVEWVCDLDLARAKSCADKFGLSFQTRLETCSDVDAVLIATPVGSRKKIMKLVQERGWHAFCEKPFAATSEDHRTMLAWAESRSLVLACGFMRRFYQMTTAARNLFALLPSGGPVQVIASDCQRIRRNPHSTEWYLTDANSSGGGFLMETGSHLVDQALSILHTPHVEIARASQLRIDSIDYETNATGSGELQDGRQLTLSLAVSRLHDLWSGIRISSGPLHIDVPLYPGAPLVLTNRDNQSKTHIEPTLDMSSDLKNAHILQMLHFAERVRAREYNSNVAETGYETTDVLSQCYGRARTQQILRKAS